MEKSVSSLRIEDRSSFMGEHEHSHDIFKCDGCRNEFHKPLLATVASRGGVQIYYACPRCLTKVDGVEEHKSREEKDASFLVESVRKPSVGKSEAEAQCKHFVGYLKKREKDAPIPDECLTCDKMIECLVR